MNEDSARIQGCGCLILIGVGILMFLAFAAFVGIAAAGIVGGI